MLTVRHARPEMRAPYRTWLRAQARTLACMSTMVVLLGSAGRGADRCEWLASGTLDCPLAAEGLLSPSTLPSEDSKPSPSP